MGVRILRYLRVSDIEDDLRKIDPSTSIVSIPGSEERRRLRDLLERSAAPEEAVRRRLWTWNDWRRELSFSAGRTPEGIRSPKGQIDPPDHWLVLRCILSGMAGDHARTAGRSGVIRLLGQEIRELLREEVPPDVLSAALAADGASADGRTDSPSRLLQRAYVAYREFLAAQGLADSAELPTLAREILPFVPDSFFSGTEIVFVGFLSFTHGQLRFIREIVSRGADVRIYAPSTGLAAHYDAANQFPEAQTSVIPSASLRGILLEAGDRRMQYETICRELILWSNAQGALPGLCGLPFPGWGDVAVVAPEKDARVAEETLARYRIPFTRRYGATVADSLPFMLAARILDLDRWNWPPDGCANLLSHPVFLGEAFPRRDFERERPRGADAWRDFLKRRVGSASSFDRAFRFARTVRGGSRPSGLLRAFVTLATEDPAWDRTLSATLRLHPDADDDLRTANLSIGEAIRKADILEGAERNLGPVGTTALAGSEAEAFLREWARSSTLWFPPERRDAAQLYLGAPPVLAHAPVWIAAGMDASAWPGTISESPLLSDERKRALHEQFSLGPSHLPLLPEVRMQREALFRRILAGGDRFTIVCRPCRDDSGKPVERSPFLKRALEPAPDAPIPFLTTVATPPESQGCRGPDIRRDLGSLLPLREEAAIIPPESRLTGGRDADVSVVGATMPDAAPERGPQVLSVSDLDLLRSCPFRFACLRILKLDDRRPGLFRADIAGKVAHTILERLSLGKTYDTGDVDRCIAEGYRDYPDLRDDPRLQPRRARFEAALRRTACSMRLLEAKLAPLRTDIRLEAPLPEATIGGVVVKGTCDRMDVFSDGSLLLFDFKSGRLKSYAQTDRSRGLLPPSLQLAAYAWLCDHADPKAPVAGTAYVCITDAAFAASLRQDPGGAESAAGGIFEGDGVPSVTNTLLGAHIPLAGEEIARSAAMIASGRYDPDHDSQDCRICGFQTLCRRSDRRREDSDDAADE